MTARWTWHGGGLAAARAHFGDGGLPWLDLSTGINPQAWPGVGSLEIDWQRLPEEGDLRALEAAAARHFGAEPQYVCAVPGTEIGLRLVGDLVPRPVSCLAPTYRTHGAMAGQARAIASESLALADGETLILANPNNPDGRRFDRPAMRGLLARRGAEGWLVVDEAFADADPEASLAGDVSDAHRLVVFRSFGKFFGLAGLRLGFVLGPSALLARLRNRLGAWPLSAAAIAIGRAAYEDAGWIAATRVRLREDAAALDAMLAGHGLRAIGECPLFRLVELGDAPALFDRLARHAILTRPFDARLSWLRLGLPRDESERARLDAALAESLRLG